MSKTSAAVKNRYRGKTYDLYQMQIRRDGSPCMDDIRAAAQDAGESVNAYIYEAIRRRMTEDGYAPIQGATEPGSGSEPDTGSGTA